MSNLELPKEEKKDYIHTVIKGTIGIVPYAGSIISEIFGLILTKPIEKRRDKWMENVVLELKNLETTLEGFKIENLKDNSEFISFLIEISQIAFKTHQEEKINYLKNSLRNYFIVREINYDKKHSFINIIEELTPTHFEILLFIHKNQDVMTGISGFQKLHNLYNKEHNNIDIYFLRKCIFDLDRVSIIRVSKDFIDLIGGGGFSTDESAPSIIILTNGKEFIDFVLN